MKVCVSSVFFAFLAVLVLVTGCAAAYSKTFKIEKPVSIHKLAVVALETPPRGACADLAAPVQKQYGVIAAKEIAKQIEGKYSHVGLSADYKDVGENLAGLWVSPEFKQAGGNPSPFDPPSLFFTFFPENKCDQMLIGKNPETPVLRSPDDKVNIPEAIKANYNAVLYITTHYMSLAVAKVKTAGKKETFISMFGYVLADTSNGAILGKGYKTENSCPVDEGTTTTAQVSSIYSRCTLAEAKIIAEQVGDAIVKNDQLQKSKN